MSRLLILTTIVFCGLFGFRHITSAQGYARLTKVPENLDGPGGFSRLAPTDKLDTYVRPGHHTVFIFSAAWCPACRALEGHLPHFLELRPDVVVRMISIDDPQRSAIHATGVNLRSIPHVVIYDADGKRVAADDGSDKSAHEMLIRWMNDEFQKPRQ
jgi:hypothetical protein